MVRPAKAAGHPIHPMLIVFPIGLWVFSLVADVIYVFSGSARWPDVAFYTMAGGLLGAAAAAIPGFIDFRAITDLRARKVALSHLLLNAAAIVIFAVDLFLRTGTEPPSPLAVALSFAGIILVGASGWLGGELVYIHGIGVDPRNQVSNAQKQKRRNNLRRIG